MAKIEGRAAQLFAAIVGLIATTAFTMSFAAAAPPQDYSPSQLSSVSNAMEQSGVEGIAWYVDDAADRIVVTADGTVSRAEIAKIKQSAGADAGAIRVDRASGAFWMTTIRSEVRTGFGSRTGEETTTFDGRSRWEGGEPWACRQPSF